MPETLQLIFEGVVDRLRIQATEYLPSLIAAGIIILGAYLMASLARLILHRLFKGERIDRFMRRSGLTRLIDPSGLLRANQLVSGTVYWAIMVAGILTGLSVFGTDLTAQLIQILVLLIPKIVLAGVIVLAGAWLSQYLARSMLVWAFNEDLPRPRWLATGVRIIVLFTAVVVAADHLDFARGVFLAAFIILTGGLTLTVSLAAGIGGSSQVRRYLERKEESEGEPHRSIWSHL